MTGITSSGDPLFQPLRVGNVTLKHRIVLAPLTRYRADANSATPTDIQAEYYEQRSSDGGLLITEATYVAEEAGGQPGAPGCYTDEHVRHWKKVTDKVHAKGGYIYLQTWALGRAQDGKSGVKIVSSSDVLDAKTGAGKDGVKPTPLTLEDIKRFQGHFVDSCKKAIEAGFDGVELHGAHGYLIDQFTQSTANNRTDDYGGSIEKRCRFALEVLQQCGDAIGQDKLGIRLSPYSSFQGMYAPDHVETFKYLSNEIHTRFPNLAYVHMVESRADPAKLEGWSKSHGEENGEETLNPFRQIFEGGNTTFLSAGGYTPEVARQVVANSGGGVVFGRHFISNPDLPYRIQHKLPLAPYDRSTFYTRSKEGYTTYENYSQPGTPQNERA